MSKIAKLSTLLFLLVAQMSVAFAGTPNDTTFTAYAGHWLVRLENDEVKTVKIVKLPTAVQFEGTEDFNEPMIRELMGITPLATFEGEKVVASYTAMIPVTKEDEDQCTTDFFIWCVSGIPSCITDIGGTRCGNGIQICVAPHNKQFPWFPCVWCTKKADGKYYPWTYFCNAQ